MLTNKNRFDGLTTELDWQGNAFACALVGLTRFTLMMGTAGLVL